jgi:hypothetical protein
MKPRSESYIIELRLLEYCLEFLQLQAHSNFGGIYRLPVGRDEFNVFPGLRVRYQVVITCNHRVRVRVT